MVIVASQLIEKFFNCHGMLAKVLHVDLPLEFINQIEGWGRDTEFPDSIHILALL